MDASVTPPPLVLLDLEETLIQSWFEPWFLPQRIAKIRAFLEEHPGAEMGLMSWAVYHDEDMVTFRRTLQQDLEAQLGQAFEERWLLHMGDWANEVFQWARKKLSREDLFDLFGKDQVFLLLARKQPEWQGRLVVLFDDAFEDLTLQVPDQQTEARIINIVRHAPPPKDTEST
jgi:hypothetical protein